MGLWGAKCMIGSNVVEKMFTLPRRKPRSNKVERLIPIESYCSWIFAPSQGLTLAPTPPCTFHPMFRLSALTLEGAVKPVPRSNIKRGRSWANAAAERSTPIDKHKARRFIKDLHAKVTNTAGIPFQRLARCD